MRITVEREEIPIVEREEILITAEHEVLIAEIGFQLMVPEPDLMVLPGLELDHPLKEVQEIIADPEVGLLQEGVEIILPDPEVEVHQVTLVVADPQEAVDTPGAVGAVDPILAAVDQEAVDLAAEDQVVLPEVEEEDNYLHLLNYHFLSKHFLI